MSYDHERIAFDAFQKQITQSCRLYRSFVHDELVGLLSRIIAGNDGNDVVTHEVNEKLRFAIEVVLEAKLRNRDHTVSPSSSLLS